MGNTVYRAVSGGLAELKRLDVLANNMAHADTPGFKADRLRFYELVDAQQGPTGFVDLPETRIDPSPGALRMTDNPLDLAILGEGWFVVDNGGQQELTRVGTFQRGASGQLETPMGQPLLSTSGTPLTLPNTPGQPIRIDPHGGVFVGDAKVGNAMLVKAGPEQLSKTAYGLFRSTTPVAHDPTVTVQQGAIEESNVNPVASMTEIVAVQRHFEAIQTALRTYRELDEQSNRRLR